MFVYNLKIKSSVILKTILVLTIFIVLCICVIIGYRLFKATTKLNDEINSKDIVTITDKNYANILKATHENIDDYIGQKFKYSGFVYRVFDLEKDEFILGRNMIISSDFQSVVVGFLCHYDESISLKDGSWIEIEGRIKKGNYQNKQMPVLEIISVKKIDKPDDEYVYPPDESYIPTSVIL